MDTRLLPRRFCDHDHLDEAGRCVACAASYDEVREDVDGPTALAVLDDHALPVDRWRLFRVPA
jgi:hypothetical protein